ncbi:MAG: Imm32 family immunity protein [Thermoanaerobaculia bacterium]
MSRPVERYSQILEEITSRFDLTHDFGRKGAYEAAIDYAREHLADDPHCNDFLKVAAKNLGFAPVSFDTIESRVKLPKGAWLDLWIAEDDDEIALTGTREGLQYLIDLLKQLKNSPDRDDHIHLDRGYEPMTDTSASLVLFKEDESWFTGAGSEDDFEPYPEREIDPKAIYAIQFIHYPPEDLPLTAQRLYRVLNVEPEKQDADTAKEFPEGNPERYYLFTFIADNGEKVTYSFHLDDPGVNYFTHKEIVSLAMQVV